MLKSTNIDQIEQWDIFELALTGPADGNPFVDVTLSAEFRFGHRVLEPDGFYDGDGVYRIRFMPDTPGVWRYGTHSNVDALDGHSGEFTCVTAGPNNHGPVYVHNQYHFAYADGAPYYPFGTTCYAWTHQGDTLEEQTLETLRTAPFNKMRMCVFPKDYVYNKNEPQHYPFQRNAAGEHDFDRFDPAFFRHFERRVGQLRDLGIEADLIVFHPYDRWGYASMEAERDNAYLRYLVARLAAYRNVWWSMANEYDFLLATKPMEQWDRYFQIVEEKDAYRHLRSIHNGHVEMNYDHSKPWISHVCIQNWDVKRVKEWRNAYRKPVIDDECEYEGDVPNPWGNISAQELVHRCWIMVVNGGYAGHGETYLHPKDILWWSKGGVLHGESWRRIAFLRAIVEEGPVGGLTPMTNLWMWSRVAAGMNGDYRLIYFGEHQPRLWSFGLPTETRFTVEVIDTWNMTITPLSGVFDGGQELTLPGRPYMALRIRPFEEGEA